MLPEGDEEAIHFYRGKESGLLFVYRPAFLDVFSLYFVIEFRIIGEAVWKFF